MKAPTVSFYLFTDNCFTSFRLFIHFGVNNIRATVILNKNRLRKCTIIGKKQLQRKERGHFEQRSAHQAKKGGLHSIF